MPKNDPSYEELPIASNFMRNLIRYMELQPNEGGQIGTLTSQGGADPPSR
jgi:hypothetical protein